MWRCWKPEMASKDTSPRHFCHITGKQKVICAFVVQLRAGLITATVKNHFPLQNRCLWSKFSLNKNTWAVISSIFNGLTNTGRGRKHNRKNQKTAQTHVIQLQYTVDQYVSCFWSGFFSLVEVVSCCCVRRIQNASLKTNQTQK